MWDKKCWIVKDYHLIGVIKAICNIIDFEVYNMKKLGKDIVVLRHEVLYSLACNDCNWCKKLLLLSCIISL